MLDPSVRPTTSAVPDAHHARFTIMPGGRMDPPLKAAPAPSGPLGPEILAIVEALARQAAREEYRRLTAVEAVAKG
jgi:hypothetical protein